MSDSYIEDELKRRKPSFIARLSSGARTARAKVAQIKKEYDANEKVKAERQKERMHAELARLKTLSKIEREKSKILKARAQIQKNRPQDFDFLGVNNMFGAPAASVANHRPKPKKHKRKIRKIVYY